MGILLMSENYNLFINWVVHIPWEGSPTMLMAKILHQLRLVVDIPFVYKGLYIQKVVVWDFWTINSSGVSEGWLLHSGNLT